MRSTVFELPLKIIFTEEGVNFFMRNKKPLNKFRMADHQEAYGISLDRFSYSSLQQMIKIDYVSKVEVASVDFISHRQGVMDISKLIVYGVLYNNFDNDIFHKLIKSDLIIRWNRLNPAKIIDERSQINDSYLESVLAKIPSHVHEIRTEILEPVKKQINMNQALLPEEKNIQLLLSEKFLVKLRPLVWYILAKYKDTRGYRDLVQDIRKSLISHLDKSKISEYLALMILELLSYVENSNIRNFVKSMNNKQQIDSRQVIYDSLLRSRIISEMKKKDEKVYISWKIKSRGNSLSSVNRVQVTIYNQESEYQEIQRRINSKSTINLKEKNLNEFYQHMPEEEANSELGLYYLSYLSDACNKVSVRFESNVNQIPGSNLTVINLNFTF
jgi:hypothetical protein